MSFKLHCRYFRFFEWRKLVLLLSKVKNAPLPLQIFSSRTELRNSGMVIVHKTLCTVVTDTMIVANANASMTLPKFDVLLVEAPIRVGWQSSDLDLFTPASAPLFQNAYLLTAATTDTTTIISTPTFIPASAGKTGRVVAPTNKSDFLSKGDKAGIGVGVALACLFVAVGILVVMHRNRRRSSLRRRAEKDTSAPGIRDRANLDGTQIYEASPHSRPAEADSTSRAELEGGWHGHEAWSKQ